jgi:transcriptional repressor NrdR
VKSSDENLGTFAFFPPLSPTYPLAFSTAFCQYVVMVCIYCGGETKVTNSRSRQKGLQTWRRRQCQSCQAVFTTIEGAQEEHSLVVKRANAYEPFLRDKLLVSVYESLKHRKTALTDASALTDTIITTLMPKFASGQIDNQTITAVAKGVLSRFDDAAAVHYQAYHQG